MLEMSAAATSWLIFVARIAMAVVFLVSAIHKGMWRQAAITEFQSSGIPMIWLTLPGTVLLHLVGSLCLIVGYMTREAALVLAIFTVVATLKVHAWWRLPKDEQLARSRIFTANLAVIGGLLLLSAVGPGPIAISP